MRRVFFVIQWRASSMLGEEEGVIQWRASSVLGEEEGVPVGSFKVPQTDRKLNSGNRGYYCKALVVMFQGVQGSNPAGDDFHHVSWAYTLDCHLWVLTLLLCSLARNNADFEVSPKCDLMCNK
jgi:hypothetical protein